MTNSPDNVPPLDRNNPKMQEAERLRQKFAEMANRYAAARVADVLRSLAAMPEEARSADALNDLAASFQATSESGEAPPMGLPAVTTTNPRVMLAEAKRLLQATQTQAALDPRVAQDVEAWINKAS